VSRTLRGLVHGGGLVPALQPPPRRPRPPRLGLEQVGQFRPLFLQQREDDLVQDAELVLQAGHPLLQGGRPPGLTGDGPILEEVVEVHSRPPGTPAAGRRTPSARPPSSLPSGGCSGRLNRRRRRRPPPSSG